MANPIVEDYQEIDDEEVNYDPDIPMDMELSIQEIEEIVNGAGIEALTPEEEKIYRVEFPEDTEQQEDTGHYANLAVAMTPGDLSRMAQDIEQWVTIDDDSRKEWRNRESKGVKILGVSEETEGGAAFDGASKVVHPLLIEAMIQFHSRSLAEMWPSEGPVKTKVLGTPTTETNAQAQRVNDYMNYLYTVDMPGAFDEEDRLLFRLPLSGSCFKKTFYCPVSETFITRMIEPTDFIVPYAATDLRTAPRFTHRFYEQVNDIKKKVQVGYYRDFEPKVTGQTPDYRSNEMRDIIDKTEGREDTEDDDQPHTMYEMYVDLILDEDTDDIARPYIVTVDKDEQTVYRIQRNWKEEDEKKRKKLCVTHYRFSPGFGFYGFGLLHLIGGLSRAATGTLRSLLDAAAFANMQGGYRSRDVKLPGGNKPHSPGEWREVRTSAEDLKKGFMPFQYKEPSKTLFELLGFLDERGQRFASTGENMVGDANNNAPVGTTLALIEQGSKNYVAIHKRLHRAHAEEFKILHNLIYEYLPQGKYPYQTTGVDNYTLAIDFDGRIDVVPVSDPNIISNTQRITMAQVNIDLAKQFPDIVNRREAVRIMLEATRSPDIEKLMIPEQEGPNAEEKAQELENEKTGVEIDKIKAETVTKNIESEFSSVQAAGSLAMQPELIPTADSLLQSAGFEDQNEFPIAQVDQQLPAQVDMVDDALPPEADRMPLPEGVEMNTSPNSPPVMSNPGEGMQEGIETQATEDNV